MRLRKVGESPRPVRKKQTRSFTIHLAARWERCCARGNKSSAWSRTTYWSRCAVTRLSFLLCPVAAPFLCSIFRFVTDDYRGNLLPPPPPFSISFSYCLYVLSMQHNECLWCIYYDRKTIPRHRHHPGEPVLLSDEWGTTELGDWNRDHMMWCK